MTGSNSISATVDIILGDIRFFASDRADTMVEVRPVDPSRELDVKAAEQANIDGTTVASPCPKPTPRKGARHHRPTRRDFGPWSIEAIRDRHGSDRLTEGSPVNQGERVGPAYISARFLSVDEERFEVLDIRVRQFDYRSFDD